MSSRIKLSEAPSSPTSIATVWGKELDMPTDAIPAPAPAEPKKEILGARDQALLAQEFSDRQSAKMQPTPYDKADLPPAEARPLIAIA